MDITKDQMKFAIEQALAHMANKAGCTTEHVAEAIMTGKCNQGVIKNFAIFVDIALNILARGPEAVKQELIEKAKLEGNDIEGAFCF
jgi:hypothetical protein